MAGLRNMAGLYPVILFYRQLKTTIVVFNWR